MAVDINRGSAGVSLPPAVSTEVWGLTTKESAIMRAARRINMPGAGVSIDTLNGVGEAQWVAETEAKPVVDATFGSKQITPHTMAIILPFSNQFRRDKAGLFREIVRVLPGKLAKLFDSTVLGSVAVPGSGFDTLGDAQQVTVDGTNTFDDLIAARAAIGVRPSAWITAPSFETMLLSAKDTDGTRPFVPNYADDLSLGRIFGAPVFGTDGGFKQSTTVGDDIGIVGDFANYAMWGSVEGIQYSESDQSSLDIEGGTTIHLWQRNMFAVRFEMEVAFSARDKSKFARITDGAVDA